MMTKGTEMDSKAEVQYEAPAVEAVIEADDLDREIQYAGAQSDR